MQRMTRQRAAIEKLLSNMDEFHSAQQIHDALRHSGSTIGLATVYRTLQAMVESSEVDAMRGTDGETLYRRCEGWEHHHHLVCKECHKTVEIESNLLENWINKVAADNGFAHVEHTTDLMGICADCSDKSEP